MDSLSTDPLSANQTAVQTQGHHKNNFLIKFIFFLSAFFLIDIVLSVLTSSNVQTNQNKEGDYTNSTTPIPEVTLTYSDNKLDFYAYLNQKAEFTPTATPLPKPTKIQNTCDRNKAQYLPDIIEITPAVYVTRTVEKEIIIGPGVITEVITTNDHIITDPMGKPPTEKEVIAFKIWASPKGIALIPTNRNYDELMNGQFDLKNDQIPLEQIGQVMNAYEALRLLPDPIIEKMRGTAIYMSTVNDTMNYALYSHRSPEEIAKLYKKNQNVVRHGIFLVQPISKRVTIHEIGHLIGTIGIEGLYGDQYSTYKNLRSEYNNIFKMQGLENIPCGYITQYSLTNDAENFADHFSYYVMYGQEFRERAATDLLLQAKYDFLKKHIFEGKEY